MASPNPSQTSQQAFVAAPVPTGTALAGAAVTRAGLDPRLFINRELSWLEFNQRVLDEAADPSLPVAERLKFLGIVA